MSMILKDKTLLILTNLYDGLYAGGIIIIAAELSAEIAYPVGESLSLGFVNSASYAVRFGIKMIVELLIFKEYDPNKDLRPEVPLAIYIILMVMFLIFTVLAYILLMKTPFTLNRSLADACIEEAEEESENNSATNDETREEGLTESLIENMKGGRK